MTMNEVEQKQMEIGDKAVTAILAVQEARDAAEEFAQRVGDMAVSPDDEQRKLNAVESLRGLVAELDRGLTT